MFQGYVGKFLDTLYPSHDLTTHSVFVWRPKHLNYRAQGLLRKALGKYSEHSPTE